MTDAEKLEGLKAQIAHAGYKVSAASRISEDTIMAFSVESVRGTNGEPAYSVTYHKASGRTLVTGKAKN